MQVIIFGMLTWLKVAELVSRGKMGKYPAILTLDANLKAKIILRVNVCHALGVE